MGFLIGIFYLKLNYISLALLFLCHQFFTKQISLMDWFRGLLAGAAAWKWGGGCLGTILVFVIVYWLLGAVGC